MSFAKDDKSVGCWKIDRFASKLGHNVVGGASKIFRFFLLNFDPNIVSTYADARYSNGNVYENMGMSRCDKLTSPGYCYVKNGRTYSRYRFQRHKLKNLYERGIFDFYDDSLTERETMFLNDYRILFGCGNHKFVWKR